MVLFRINLLVIQHIETMYLGENHVRVVCERMWKKAQDCALSRNSRLNLAIGSRGLQVAKGCTRVKHAEELNSHVSWSTTGQKVHSGHSVNSRLGLATQSSCEAKSPVHSIWEKLTLRIPYTHQYKYPLYPRNVEIFQREFWERNLKKKQDWLIHNLHPLILQIPLLSHSPLLHPWEVR